MSHLTRIVDDFDSQLESLREEHVKQQAIADSLKSEIEAIEFARHCIISNCDVRECEFLGETWTEHVPKSSTFNLHIPPPTKV